MRELKFRAFRKIFKTMHEIYSVGKHTCIIWADIEHANGDKERVLMEVNRSEVEIMQYTGLKDKNGKEIYEEDIIKFFCWSNLKQCNWWWTDRVFFKDGSYYADYRVDAWAKEPTLEVIGNTYENPEMLVPKSL
jgi:uncharacterized phage protein (TIGR01671 family)